MPSPPWAIVALALAGCGSASADAALPGDDEVLATSVSALDGEASSASAFAFWQSWFRGARPAGGCPSKSCVDGDAAAPQGTESEATTEPSSLPWELLGAVADHADDDTLFAIRLTSKRAARVVESYRPDALARAAVRALAQHPETPPSAKAVAALRRLTTLDMSRVAVAGDRLEAINRILALTPNLLELDVSCPKGDDGCQKLGLGIARLALRAVPDLRRLVLRDNDIGNAGARTLPLDQAPNLSHLDVGANGIGPAGMEGLRLEATPGLQHLDVSWNHLGADGARHLPLGKTPLLRHLSVSGNGIRAEGARHLPLHQTPHLVHLDVSHNRLGVEGARDLPLHKVPTLQQLALSENEIGAEGARALPLDEVPNLLHLDVSANCLDEDGAEALPLAKAPNLQHLDVGYNLFGDDGARSLRLDQTPDLRYLDVRLNLVSAKVAGEWAKRLPSLVVVR